jgi:hypothetical protein
LTSVPGYVWLVFFSSGVVYNDSKSVGWFARAVRGGR